MPGIGIGVGIPLGKVIEDPYYQVLRGLYGDWPVDMLKSYESINNHSYFTNPQKNLISSRLAESYVETTFGPAGQNKTVCDFFLFFENSNTTTALSTTIILKTGDAIRWNYGDSNIYLQDDLPAQINNGVITITSDDGFANCTSFDINENTFINSMPSFRYFVTANKLSVYNNGFTGAMPDFSFNVELDKLWVNTNDFTKGPSSLTTLTKLSVIFLYNNLNLAGSFPDITGLTTLTYIRYDNTKLRGVLPDLSNNASFATLYCNNNKCTGIASTSFSTALGTFLLNDDLLATTEIDQIIADLNTYYSANTPIKNLAVNVSGFGNGTITGGDANADLVSLKAAYVNAGFTATVTYNAESSRFAEGHLILSHDDMRVSAYTKAFPLLEERNLIGTFCCVSDWVTDVGFVDWDEVKEIQDAGHEISSHGQDHQPFTDLTDVELRAQLDAVDAAFLANSITEAVTVAYPFGQNDGTIRATCAEYYTLGRSAASLVIYPTTDKFLLGVRNIDQTTESTILAVKEWAEKHYYGNTTGMYLYHDLVEGVAVGSQINENIFEEILDYVVSLGIDVIRMEDLLPLLS